MSSSSDTDPPVGTHPDIEAFLGRHGLDPDLREPLERLLQEAVTQVETVLRGDISGLMTLVVSQAPEDDGHTVPPLTADELAEEHGDSEPGSTDLLLEAMLGRGGMGQVFRARDRSLNRALAVKVLHDKFQDEPIMRARFQTEAQITAQLAHPGIPPVHGVGTLPTGQPFFTMKEVQGQTLSEVIAEAHSTSETAQRWTEARLLDVFQRVCEAVAYAHSRGVIHCDLKPPNVMVGAFGEVMVMDWGVARLVRDDEDGSDTKADQVSLVSLARKSTTVVAGTPAYMPPEQGSGAHALLGPHSDVYALGTMLYELLAGRRPYAGTPAQLVWQGQAGEIPALELPAGSTVDAELEAMIHRAMAPKPEDRYADASAMSADLASWREGSARKERARVVAREAQARLPEVAHTRAKAMSLRGRAAHSLARLGLDASVDEKRAVWRLQDEASALERQVGITMVEVVQRLHGALAHAPELAEAHALLSRIHHERHQEAEARRDWSAAAREEIRLRAHDTGTHSLYLKGVSAFVLHTEPPCSVSLERCESSGRQLVPRPLRELGTTPLVDVELDVGGYMLELTAEGRAPTRYPLWLERSHVWTGRPPGQRHPYAIPLPGSDELTDGEVYVPAGWCRLGGDERAPGAVGGKAVWVPGFIIGRRPVTARELAQFLASDHAGAAAARRSVLRSGVTVFRGDWPATGVSWHVARAFAAWQAETTGQPWRLPTEAEWEKAARGVDGRWYPWGDEFDPVFAHVRAASRVPLSPRAVTAFPEDRSPYGVLGMAGNTRDWCADPFEATGPLSVLGPSAIGVVHMDAARYAVRGGSHRLPKESARVAARSGIPAHVGAPDIGFRLVRSYP